MELNKKLQVLESLNTLKQKIDIIDLTDQERELFNSWYNEHTAFFNEFVIKIFNKMNVNFMFFLPSEIIIKLDGDDNNLDEKFREVFKGRNFSAEISYQYIDDDLYVVVRPKDEQNYNSNSLMELLKQLDKHKLYYKLLYQL